MWHCCAHYNMCIALYKSNKKHTSSCGRHFILNNQKTTSILMIVGLNSKLSNPGNCHHFAHEKSPKR